MKIYLSIMFLGVSSCAAAHSTSTFKYNEKITIHDSFYGTCHGVITKRSYDSACGPGIGTYTAEVTCNNRKNKIEIVACPEDFSRNE